MIPDNDETVATGRAIERRRYGYIPVRCSICRRLIWRYSIALEEPPEVPESRYEWVLCKPCYDALLIELSRSTLRSPLRLRIAIGLVAADRSPQAHRGARSEQEQFSREFAWFTWAIIIFAVLHVVILVIIWTIPK
jgi:hypothetical protein